MSRYDYDVVIYVSLLQCHTVEQDAAIQYGGLY
jgi:hypothetical protein